MVAMRKGTPRPTPRPAIWPGVYIASGLEVGVAVIVICVVGVVGVACAARALLTAGLIRASSSLVRRVMLAEGNVNSAELFLQFVAFWPHMNSLDSPSFVHAVTGMLVFRDTDNHH